MGHCAILEASSYKCRELSILLTLPNRVVETQANYTTSHVVVGGATGLLDRSSKALELYEVTVRCPLRNLYTPVTQHTHTL